MLKLIARQSRTCLTRPLFLLTSTPKRAVRPYTSDDTSDTPYAAAAADAAAEPRPYSRQFCVRCRAVDHQVWACPFPKRCHNCGSVDHVGRQCPKPRACSVCGSEDHLLKDCSQPKVCSHCGSKYHLRNDCTRPKDDVEA